MNKTYIENKCFGNCVTLSPRVFSLAGFSASIFHANNQPCRIIYAKMSANWICTTLYIPCEALTNYRIASRLCCHAPHSRITFRFVVQQHAALRFDMWAESHRAAEHTWMSQHSFACTLSLCWVLCQVLSICFTSDFKTFIHWISMKRSKSDSRSLSNMHECCCLKVHSMRKAIQQNHSLQFINFKLNFY